MGASRRAPERIGADPFGFSSSSGALELKSFGLKGWKSSTAPASLGGGGIGALGPGSQPSGTGSLELRLGEVASVGVLAGTASAFVPVGSSSGTMVGVVF